MNIRRTVITGAAAPALLAGGTAAGYPASARTTVAGTEHFQLVGTSLKSSNIGKAAAYGVFNASGIDRRFTGSRAVFIFPGGSFFFTHKTTRSQQHLSKATCSATVALRGVCTLSRGSGKYAGMYAGINGHGRFAFNDLFVYRHTAGGCSKRPIAMQGVVRAQGPVTLP